MNAGAKGYITKHAHPEILITAIQKIAEGEVYIEQGLIRHEKAFQVRARKPAIPIIKPLLSHCLPENLMYSCCWQKA